MPGTGVTGFFDTALKKSIFAFSGSVLALGWRWPMTLCDFGAVDGLVGAGLSGFCCCCDARRLLPKRKPQLGQAPDALPTTMPHFGHLCWCFVAGPIWDDCGMAACISGRAPGPVAPGIEVRGCVEPIDVTGGTAPSGCSGIQRKPHLGHNLDLLGSWLRQLGQNILPQLLQSGWSGDILEWQKGQRVILGSTLLSFSDHCAASWHLYLQLDHLLRFH